MAGHEFMLSANGSTTNTFLLKDNNKFELRKTLRFSRQPWSSREIPLEFIFDILRNAEDFFDYIEQNSETNCQEFRALFNPNPAVPAIAPLPKIQNVPILTVHQGDAVNIEPVDKHAKKSAKPITPRFKSLAIQQLQLQARFEGGNRRPPTGPIVPKVANAKPNIPNLPSIENARMRAATKLAELDPTRKVVQLILPKEVSKEEQKARGRPKTLKPAQPTKPCKIQPKPTTTKRTRSCSNSSSTSSSSCSTCRSSNTSRSKPSPKNPTKKVQKLSESSDSGPDCEITDGFTFKANSLARASVFADKIRFNRPNTFRFEPLRRSDQNVICQQVADHTDTQIVLRATSSTCTANLNSALAHQAPIRSVKITGDGNCFFRCLSYILTGDENSIYDLLRKLLNNFITNHYEITRESKDYVENNLARWDRDGEFAEDSHFFMTAALFNTPLFIWTGLDEPMKQPRWRLFDRQPMEPQFKPASDFRGIYIIALPCKCIVNGEEVDGFHFEPCFNLVPMTRPACVVPPAILAKHLVEDQQPYKKD